MNVSKQELESIYDKLCAALTFFEEGLSQAGDLYNVMVEAANDLEAILY